MDIEEARRRIEHAKQNHPTKLYLSRVGSNEKLLRDNLILLMPEIKELTKLSSLYLYNNDLENVDFLYELNGLKELDLRGNKLKNVEFLRVFKNLVSLDLGNNDLMSVDSLKENTSLELLFLGDNNLQDVNFLENLTNLKVLDVKSNSLRNCYFIKDLFKLKFVNLSNNRLQNVEIPVTLMPKFNEINELVLDEHEINQIRNYYKQLEEGKDYVYESRVLVVGEPKAGKTTLTQKVKDNDYWCKNHKNKDSFQTVGIEIDKLSFPYTKDKSKEITAHYWDFGGQDIQYVLHQYFFTERSLYLLLADGRKELPNFNYWFEIIATLGRNCPVLVVLNENGGKPVKTFNINEYRNQFGEHLESIEEEAVNFYDDSDGRFENLKNKIETKISNLKHIGMALPKTWVDVRKELEKIKPKNPYIGKDQFLKICEKCNLTNKDYIAQVIDYLHDLGIALNYKHDTNLRNKFILQPNWVIDALYVVLQDNKIEKDCGMFEVEYIESLWKEQGYSFKDCEILLGLMQKGKFEIAYKLKENKFIVPILLPYKPSKDYELEDTNEIQTHIEYTFMPKGIVPRLIVRLHKNILSINDEQIVWNKGVLLSHHNTVAEVIEREQSKQITIRVIGENTIHNKELLTIIRNEIVGIHRDWFENRLVFDELVPCVCDVCKQREDKTYYKLKKLEERLRNNKTTIECGNEPYHDVNVFELLSATYIVEKRKDEDFSFREIVNSNINININRDITDSTIKNLVKQSNNNESIIKKLVEKVEELSLNQTKEIESLVKNLAIFIDYKIDELGKKEVKETKEYQDFKVSQDVKAKLKASIPIIPMFMSLDIEKEWKVSEDIKPETFIERLRSWLHLQKIDDKPLKLED